MSIVLFRVTYLKMIWAKLDNSHGFRAIVDYFER